MRKIIKTIIEYLIGIFYKKIQNPPVNVTSEPANICGDKIADPDEFNILEDKILKRKEARGSNKNREVTTDYVIPLVFHIIHKGEPIGTGTNISDSQIYSAVNALNEDYSKELVSNGDGYGVKTPFRFILMNKDENGEFSTGIYRVNGAAKSAIYAQDGIRSSSKGVLESIVKGWSRQNNQWVYNIWIVSEIDGNGGGSGVQGYAYFPTKSLADGIVQLYNATGVRHQNSTAGSGPYSFNLKSYTNLNRTLTHEMGHALSLFHTFQGNSCQESNCASQGDRVCDTPPTIQNSNGNYPACGGTQQVWNYMDYTNQTFKNGFTQGQVDRMISAFEFSRANFITTGAYENLQSITAEADLQIISPKEIQCKNSEGYITVRVSNLSNNVIHKIEFEYIIDGYTGNYVWYGPIAPAGLVGYDDITIGIISTLETKEITVNIIKINDNPFFATDTKTMIIPTNDPYMVNTKRDVLEGQISWELTDAISGNIIYKNPLQENFKALSLTSSKLCLPDGNYIFTIRDTVPGLQTPGAYIKLIDPNGTVLVNATDGFSVITHEFTVGTPVDPDPVDPVDPVDPDPVDPVDPDPVDPVDPDPVDPDPVDPDPVDPVDPVDPDPVDPVDPDPVDPVDPDPVDPDPIEFKAIKLDQRYDEGRNIIEFILNVKNDKKVDRYNLYKTYKEDFKNLVFVNSIRSEKTTNVSKVYRILDVNYNQSPTYYIVEILKENGKTEYIFKTEARYKIEDSNRHWYLKGNSINSNKYKFEDIAIFTEKGKEVKNQNLTVGIYVLVFGNVEKEIIEIYFSHNPNNHWMLKEGSIYSNRSKFEDIIVINEEGKVIENRNLTSGRYMVKFGKENLERIDLVFEVKIIKD